MYLYIHMYVYIYYMYEGVESVVVQPPMSDIMDPCHAIHVGMSVGVHTGCFLKYSSFTLNIVIFLQDLTNMPFDNQGNAARYFAT